MLTLVEVIGKNKYSQIKCRYKCDCGNYVIALHSNVKSGNTKSCGCLKSKTTADRNKKHGLSKTPIYFLWKAMKQRCLNPNNKDYYHYGGRGVGICEAWMDFINFYNDMYEAYIKHEKLYGHKNTTLDRIDVNKDYEPSNCRWTTWSIQNTNKRIFQESTEITN